jgi:hypothetical protein
MTPQAPTSSMRPLPPDPPDPPRIGGGVAWAVIMVMSTAPCTATVTSLAAGPGTKASAGIPYL